MTGPARLLLTGAPLDAPPALTRLARAALLPPPPVQAHIHYLHGDSFGNSVSLAGLGVES